MSQDGVVVTLINQDSEVVELQELKERDEAPLEEEEGESASEGDIEIEHLVEDGSETQGEGGENGSSVANSITFDVRKRTLITLWQRTILEEFFRAGMSSASMQLNSLHQAAAEKTGLDPTVVKNWIRNRRRPAAIKSAERLAEKISHGELPYSSTPYAHQPPLTTLVSLLPPSTPITVTSLMQPHPLPAVASKLLLPTSTQQGPPALAGGLVNHHGMGHPDPKRIALEQSLSSTRIPSPSLLSSVSSSSSPSIHPLHLLPTHIASTTTSSSSVTTTSPLLIKIRVSNSGETDFYEVELPSLSYETLSRACAEELEVEVSQILKIRKLPNILIRKDRDVQRLRDGQELEVVLKDTSHLNAASYSSNGGLSILNIPLTDALPLSGVGGGSGPSNITLQPTSHHVNGLP